MRLFVSEIRWDSGSVSQLIPQIHCPPGRCRRCCTELAMVRVLDEEVGPIARLLKTNPKNLRRRWQRAEDGHGFVFPQPCEFSTPKGCLIYQARPIVCQLWPLLRWGDPQNPLEPPQVAVILDLCDAGAPCIRQLEAWQRTLTRR